MILTLRCSSLPLAFRCPASVRRGDLVLNETNDASAAGTATHDVLRGLPDRGFISWDAIPEIAARHGAAADEVRVLSALGAKLWPQIAGSFPNAVAEVGLQSEIAPGVTLMGHADLFTVTADVARGLDWKSGRKDSDYSHQMRGYCTLIALDNPDVQEVSFTLGWIRDQEIETYRMTRAEVFAWLRELVETVVNWDGVYRPGDHCAHCPREHECAARNALVRRDVAAFTDKALVYRAEAELATMTAAEIIELEEKAANVERYAGRVRDAVKLHVLKNGDIEANGKRLTIETEERRQLDPILAWPVLESAGFVDDDFASCMDLRISKVEKRVAEKAGKGRGASAVRDLKEKLSAAKAVEVKEVQKLAHKRA